MRAPPSTRHTIEPDLLLNRVLANAIKLLVPDNIIRKGANASPRVSLA